MKHITIFKLIFSLAALILPATVKAQSAAVKKASESVFTLTTFNTDGSIHATSHGVFVGKSGEAISDLKPFLGASKAVVIDAKGNKKDVTRILGLNDIYDVVKFKVDGNTKPAAIANTVTTPGGKLWLLPYSNKSAKPEAATVKSVEKFMDKFSYYIFDYYAKETTEACPFVNDNGEVAGLLQTSTTSTEAHATDAAFIMQLTTSGLSVTDDTYRKIGIPAALPTEKNQALLALMLATQSNDSLKSEATTSDFITAFPTLADGYVAKAEAEVNRNDFEAARKTMETAVDRTEPKDEIHYNYAKLMYMKELYRSDIAYAPWSLDKAIDEVTKAYSINALPIYKDLEGQILFAKKDYQKAYDTFMALTDSKLKNGDLYYNAAQCKDMMKAPDTEVLALLDSAVNNIDTLNVKEGAKYFIMRGDVYNRMENYRQAVFDYTRYEVIEGKRQAPQFYYVREQAEVKAKLFKQALSDIDIAIYLAPDETSFKAEKASLQLRLNLISEAMQTAEQCVKEAPDYSDGYLILGLAQINSGKKEEGLANLDKAKNLGNSQATSLIEKYKK